MIILYTSPGCASCRKAKQWLKDNQLPFVEKNIFTTMLKEDEIITFGDGHNDIPMLRMCPYSVAMGNAIEEVKENAAYVTTDIDDDGIYNALKHFQII